MPKTTREYVSVCQVCEESFKKETPVGHGKRGTRFTCEKHQYESHLPLNKHSYIRCDLCPPPNCFAPNTFHSHYRNQHKDGDSNNNLVEEEQDDDGDFVVFHDSDQGDDDDWQNTITTDTTTPTRKHYRDPTGAYSENKVFLENYMADDVGECSKTIHRYLEREQKGLSEGTKCRGLKQLVLDAFQGNWDFRGALPSDKEVYFHILMTCFLVTLTVNQIQMFAELLHIVVTESTEMGKRGNGTSDTFKSRNTWIPRNLNELQKIYLKGEKSILKNVPSPSVFGIGSTYAVTSIRDVIRCLFLFSPPEDIKENDNQATSKNISRISALARRLCPDFTPFKVRWSEWMDKFDTYGTKRNRKSIHVTSTTFFGPDNEMYTYPITFGGGSADITAMHNYLHRAYTELTGELQYFWDPRNPSVDGHHIMTPAVCLPECCIQDRVERNSTTKTLSHSSPWARRMSYICFLRARTLMPCQACHNRRVHHYASTEQVDDALHTVAILEQNTCTKCLDLNFHGSLPEEFEMVIPRPEKYPKTFQCNTLGCTECGDPSFLPENFPIPANTDAPFSAHAYKITFASLKAALRLAIHMYRKKAWNVAESETYLRVCGVSPLLWKDTRKFMELHEDENLSDEQIFEWAEPFTWKRGELLPLGAYTEAPMHLLKGIGGDVFDDIESVLSKWKKFTPMTKGINEWLTAANKLQLQWLRLIPFGGKDHNSTGPFVSENYLDLARCQTLLYLIEAEKLGLQNRKGFDVLIRFLHYHECIVSRILADVDLVEQTPGFADVLHDYVKMFLYTMHRLEKYFVKLKVLPMENKGNGLSLLNLQQSIRENGAPRRHFDGYCEANVGLWKPDLRNIRFSDTFFPLKLKHIHQVNSLQYLKAIAAENACVPPSPKISRYQRYFRVYKSKSAVGILGEDSVNANAEIDDKDIHEWCSAFQPEGKGAVFVAYHQKQDEILMEQLAVEFNTAIDVAGQRNLHKAYPVKFGDGEPLPLTFDEKKVIGVSFIRYKRNDGKIYCAIVRSDRLVGLEHPKLPRPPIHWAHEDDSIQDDNMSSLPEQDGVVPIEAAQREEVINELAAQQALSDGATSNTAIVSEDESPQDPGSERAVDLGDDAYVQQSHLPHQ